MIRLDQRGLSSLVTIIIALFVVGGAVAVANYINTNQSDIQDQVDQSQTDYEASLTQEYPDLYTQAGLPEYPNGTITKEREGRNLEDGVQVTLETSDDMATIRSFFDTEMAARGFTLPDDVSNPMVFFGIYTNADKSFTLQITQIESSSDFQVYVNYHE